MTQRRNLTDRVHTLLLDKLVNRTFKVDERLIFVELARDFEVSRTPVNNALSILAHQGYVDLAPNCGYTVHHFSHDEVEELRDVKQTLEQGLLERGVQQLNQAGRKRLLRLKKGYEQAVQSDNQAHLAKLDIEFHASIIGLSGNRAATNLYREVRQKLTLAAQSASPKGRTRNPRQSVTRRGITTRQQIPENLAERMQTNTCREHDDIFTAICAGDHLQVMALLQSHSDQPVFLDHGHLPEKSTALQNIVEKVCTTVCTNDAMPGMHQFMEATEAGAGVHQQRSLNLSGKRKYKKSAPTASNA